jgi:hypothetical protein
MRNPSHAYAEERLHTFSQGKRLKKSVHEEVERYESVTH